MSEATQREVRRVETGLAQVVHFFSGGEIISLGGRWKWDLHSDAVFCSDVMIAWPADLQGTKSIVHPEDVEKVKETVSSERFNISFRIITTYGEIKTISGKEIFQVETDPQIYQQFVTWDQQVFETEWLKRKAEFLGLQKEVYDEAERYGQYGSWYLNTDTFECYYSDGVFRLHKLLPQSLNAHAATFQRFIHPEDAAIVTDSLEKAYKEKLPLHLEFRVVTNDGNTIHVRYIARWRFNDRGQSVFYGAYYDITGQVFSERTIASLQNQLPIESWKLQKAEELSASGSFEFNIITRKASFSHGIYRILGLKSGSILTLPVLIKYIHPEDRKKFEQTIKNDIANHIVSDLQFRVVRTDGKVRTILRKGNLFITPEGEPLIVGNWQDITDIQLHNSKTQKTTEELKLKTFLYDRAEEISSVGSWLWDIEGGKISFTPNCYRLLNVKQGQSITPELIKERIHPDDIKEFNQHLQRIIKKEENTEFTFRILYRQQQRYVKASFRMMHHADKRLFVGTLKDVTENHELRETLTERISFIETLTESLPDILIVTDMHHNIVVFNKTAEKVYALKKDEVLHRNIFDVFPQLKRQDILEHLSKALSGTRVHLPNYPHQVKKGYINIDLVPIHNAADEVIGVLHYLHDVTKEYSLHKQLTQRLAFIERMIEATVDRIVVLDKNMNYQYWNSRAEEYYGLNKEQVIGKNILEVFPQFRNDVSYDQFRRVLKGETIHIEAKEEEGTDTYSETYLIPIKEDSGEVVSVLWIVHDLTREFQIQKERKEATAEILRLKDEIAQKATDKYQSLFNAIDEAFEIIEIIYNEANEPIDFRFLETNPAFEQQTGLKNVVGKLASEVTPNMEAYWLEAYAKVVTTGEPIRHENYNADTQGWYSFYCFRVGSENNRLVAILFNNITERKQREQQQQLLLHLSDKLSVADSLKDVQNTVTNLLHKHYDAGWCYYVEWDEENGSGVVQYDTRRDDLLSLAGTHDVSDIPEFFDFLKSGQILNVSDYQNFELLTPKIRERYTAAGFRSMLVASLIRQGRLISSLLIGDTKVRNWSRYDEALLAEVAERTWAAVERAKAEEALRESEEKYRTLFESIDEGFYACEVIFDENNEPVDILYLEENPAAVQMIGQSFVGKTLKQINPAYEPYWFQIWGEVALTGEGRRMEQYSRADGKWFDFYISKTGDSESRRVTVVFNDITERKQREQQQEFLLKFSDTLRASEDADNIVNQALQMLAEHLHLDRCHVGVYNLEKDWCEFPYQVGNEQVPPMPKDGLPLSGFPDALRIASDETLIISDFQNSKGLTETDKRNFKALGFGAAIIATVRKGEKKPLWSIAAVSATPRNWTELEIQLLEQATERTWAAVERAKAEEALSKSEEKYRTLFNSIDEGFSVVEMMFDENGKAVDYIFRELNPTHEKLTGLPSNVIGMRIKELMPNLEEEVLQRFGKVMLTGEPARYEQYISALDRWFDVYTVRVGGSESRLVANVFTNITERKRREQQQEYLLRLNDELRSLADPIEIERTAMQVLGEHLQVDRVVYSNINVEEDYFEIHDNYARGSVQKITGRFPFSAFGDSTDKNKNGETLIIHDVSAAVVDHKEREQFFAMNVHAVVAIPLIKKGKLVMNLSVHQTKPRQWKKDEIALIQETAERTWAAVERAKAEEALRQSESRLAQDLANAKQLQQVSNALLENEDPQLLYNKILDAAKTIMNSHLASIQVFVPEKAALKLMLHHGFHPQSAKLWQWVTADAGSVCGIALAENKRIIIPDVEAAFSNDANSLEPFRLSGIRAVQSTPLISRSGKIMGMLSTHWKEAHQPTEHELNMLDVLARLAADIIEHKKAEEVLRSSEERLQKAISIDTVGVLFFNLDGSMTGCNKAFEQMIGYTDEELQKLHWKVMTPDEFMDVTTRAATDLAETGETAPYEKQMIRKDGSRFWALCAPRRLQGKGINSQCVEFIIDITERKRAEEYLRTSEQRLQRMVNIPRVGVLTFNYDGTMLHANDAFLEMVGYSRDEFEMRQFTWRDFTPPEYVGVSTDVMKLLKDTGRGGPYEKEYIRKDGSRIWMMFVAADLGDGTIAEYAIDISDRKTAEEKLHRFNEMLEQQVAEQTAELRRSTEAIKKNLTILQQAEDLAQIGSWEYDVHTSDFHWSEGMYNLFGLPNGIKVTPQTYLDFAFEEDRAIAKRIVSHLKKKHQPFEEMLRIKTSKDDGYRLLRIKGSVVPDEKAGRLKW